MDQASATSRDKSRPALEAPESRYDAKIPIRRPALRLSRDLPRHWYAGAPFASHFMDALSSTFPMGEAFFVRSVLYYRDQIDDPKLLAEIRGFAGQEGQHSRVHADHVQLLVDQGYSLVERRNRFVERILRWFNRKQPVSSLAVTASLEHLTSILARQILTHPERFTDVMHSEMAALWRWHALEEAEHKSVAFDVMTTVMGNGGRCHLARILAQASNTLGFSLEVFERVAYMLWKDGLLFKLDVWREGGRFLFGVQGLFRGVGDDYRAWYRRDFHPDQVEDRAMIIEKRPEILQEMARSCESGG